MNKFVRNLLTEWRKLKLPFDNETIVVAVSGGADSVSLALALYDLKERKKLNHQFVIAHFNHNLRGIKSNKEAEFVKELAEKLKFEFAYKIQESKIQNQKGNLEQNARNARYEFLSQIAQKYNANVVLIAHTKNDQAETLLLNLFRGSGLDGLGGIKTVRKQRLNGKKKNFGFLIIRPLINWAKREDTEKFCVENKIEYCQDEMNEDLKYSRVKIRKEIIPLLKKINPQIIDTLSNTANLLQEDAQELSNLSKNKLEDVSKKKLKNYSKSMRLRILRNWLELKRGNLRQIDLKHIESIERLIFSRKSGKFIELPEGEKVLKSDGKIIFEKSGVEKCRCD